MDEIEALRVALQSRLEADAFLGARDLPFRYTPPSTPGDTRRANERPQPPRISPSRSEAERPPSGPVVATQSLDSAVIEERLHILQTLDETQVRGCTKCGLAETRTKTVFGQGSPAARIVFVGEGPGAEEDRTGLAFVGRAGELLTAMIERGMGLRREDVYICNVIKCRPPGNRTPAPDEITACSPYLFEQIRTIQPDVVIALGAPAAQTLLSTRESIGRLRGRFHDFYPSGSPLVGDPIPLMPTFHPAYLLRSPQEKGKAWEDLKMVMARLGLPLPKR
jgi:uracil-DNA glycosylase family 4